MTPSEAKSARPWLRRIGARKGDLSGGFASAVLAVGGNVAVGVIAFAPLSEDFISLGVLAGMLSSIVGGLLASFTGGAPGMVTGPRPTTAMVFAGLLTSMGLILGVVPGDPAADRLLISLAFGAVTLSGFIQLSLAAVGFGELGKFIPYPVVAGIRTATALLLVYGQAWLFMGVDRQPILQFLGDPRQFQWTTLLVALTTSFVAWKGHRVLPKALVFLAALIAGTAVYQGLAALSLGPVGVALTPLSLGGLSLPDYSEWWGRLGGEAALPLATALLSGAVAMALLDSMSLISLVTFQDMTGRRCNGSQQLVGQGVGTVGSALLGGLSTTGALQRSLMNHAAGGRTKISGVLHSLLVLGMGVVVASALGFVPKAAVAGLVMVMAFQLFDPWTLKQWREWRREAAFERRDNRNNLLEMAGVVAVGLVTNLIWPGFGLVCAVGAGVVVSVFSFAVGMARDPFRRIRTGRDARSWRERHERLRDILDEEARGVALIQLKGAVFFGTCDRIVEKIDQVVAELPADVGRVFVVLDLERVPSVDATGYKVLGQTYKRLRQRRKAVELVFSSVTPGGRRKEIAEELVAVGVPPENMFYSTDDALEHFEEELIEEHDAYEPREAGWTVRDFGNTWDLREEESAALETHAAQRAFAGGECLFEEGDSDRSMFMLAKGTVDVFLRSPEERRRRRVATFSPGTVIGEMALLDGEPRGASVHARSDVRAFELSLDALDRLRSDHPTVAARIEARMGRLARTRLRYANRIIKELDS